MASGRYFDKITTVGKLQDQLKKHGYPKLDELVNRQAIPQANSWSTAQLYASRVVVTANRSNLLALPQDALGPRESDMEELSKIIRPLRHDQLDLSETELVQQLGMAGMFWAALHKFTRTPLVPASSAGAGESRSSDIDMFSDASELMEDEDDLPWANPDVSWTNADVSRPQRIRIQTQHEGYVPSDMMQVQSSSPLGQLSSSNNSSSRAGHVAAEEHTRRAIVEDATVQLASTFVRHTLIYSNDARTRLPLLQYDGVRRRLQASLVNGALKLVAVPDGEINLLYYLTDRFTQPQSPQSPVVALLECKRRFERIVDGEPTIPDAVLGQITAEALAWRFSELSIGFGSELVNIFPCYHSLRFLCCPLYYIPKVSNHWC